MNKNKWVVAFRMLLALSSGLMSIYNGMAAFLPLKSYFYSGVRYFEGATHFFALCFTVLLVLGVQLGLKSLQHLKAYQLQVAVTSLVIVLFFVSTLVYFAGGTYSVRPYITNIFVLFAYVASVLLNETHIAVFDFAMLEQVKQKTQQASQKAQSFYRKAEKSFEGQEGY